MEVVLCLTNLLQFAVESTHQWHNYTDLILLDWYAQVKITHKIYKKNIILLLTVSPLTQVTHYWLSSSISNTSITLSFTLIEDHLNVTNYTISYSNNNNKCFSESDDITRIPGNETMYTLIGLQEGTEYSMTVIGYLSNGESVTRSKVNSTMPSG